MNVSSKKIFESKEYLQVSCFFCLLKLWVSKMKVLCVMIVDLLR